MEKIHFNCDMGEGLGNEAELMPLIQAANIACGGHAGDRETMERVMDLATDHGVQIGIHPSYPDRENFGRVKLNIPLPELQFAWDRQFEDFLNISQRKNISVNHIKPHGALYYALSEDQELAEGFLETCKKYLPDAKMYTAPKFAFLHSAKLYGFISIAEGFADRVYMPSGKLVSRGEPDAIIQDAAAMAQQAINMWQNGMVIARNGDEIPMSVNTICIHGDHPNTVKNLKWFFSKYISER